MEPADERAVESFRAYLRMRSDHPNPTPGYNAAEPLLRGYAERAGWGFERLELEPGHPMYILSWAGRDPEAPSIVLLNHMDVVPVDMEKWTVDPWAGELRDGKLYGRGAQDMKSVGIQYLEACTRLAGSGYRPLRSVHLLFVPDEEVGGSRGIKLLLAHERIAQLRPGFFLDEGLASPSDAYSCFYGERKIWWIRVKAEGPAGHGSRFVRNTAVIKLTAVLDKFQQFHEQQRRQLEATCGCGKQLGDYTTANVTMLSAGNPDPATPQFNVIPTTAVAGIDLRIPATVDLPAFKAQLDAWCAEVEGGGVTWEPLPAVCGEGQRALQNPTTPVEGPDAHWWRVFSGAMGEGGFKLHEPSIFPAATDSRWIRLILGAPCLGFSPMRRTPILLHDHDEFVALDVFLEGVRVYQHLIPRLADDDSYKAAAAQPQA